MEQNYYLGNIFIFAVLIYSVLNAITKYCMREEIMMMPENILLYLNP